MLDVNYTLAPSRQPHYGPMIDPDPVSRYLDTTGQLNPIIARQLKAEHGRYLSGVDDMTEGNAMNPDDDSLERDQHRDVYDAEDNDDVLGSGIFDPYDRPGTANTNTGVFTSHYSLPGYLAREVPFTTSTDVTDLTDDASIVSVPGGGMAYVEGYGHLLGPASFGPQPPSPYLRPAPPTSRDQGYVSLTGRLPRGWDVDTLLDHADMSQVARRTPGEPAYRRPVPMPMPNGNGGPLSVPPTMQPPATMQPDLSQHPTADVAGFGDFAPTQPPAFPFMPGSPSMYRPFPPAHPARDPFFTVQGVPTWPRHGQVPIYPSQRQVPHRSYVDPMGARIAMGQEPAKAATSMSSLFAYAAAGVAVGVALKIFHGAVTK